MPVFTINPFPKVQLTPMSLLLIKEESHRTAFFLCFVFLALFCCYARTKPPFNVIETEDGEPIGRKQASILGAILLEATRYGLAGLIRRTIKWSTLKFNLQFEL